MIANQLANGKKRRTFQEDNNKDYLNRTFNLDKNIYNEINRLAAERCQSKASLIYMLLSYALDHKDDIGENQFGYRMVKENTVQVNYTLNKEVDNKLKEIAKKKGQYINIIYHRFLSYGLKHIDEID